MAGAFRANPVLSGGMLTKHPCLGMSSGAHLHPPGSPQPLGHGERLGFSGTEVTSYHACQHHSTGPSLHPGRHRCVLLFHHRTSGRMFGASRGWGSGLAELSRKNYSCSGPSTRRSQGGQALGALPNLAPALPAGRAWLKLDSLCLLLSSGHSCPGTSD